MRVRDRLRAWRGGVLLGALSFARLLCRGPLLRRPYHAMLIRLVRASGLFDRAYYLEANGDVAERGIAPLRHYVSYGDREGRSPMPLFEPPHYLAQAGRGARRVNTLLHYVWVGRFRGYSPSAWFDLDFYLAQNKDVRRAGIDPLVHYLRWGGKEGRSPCAQFDGAFYLRSNPDVARAGINPLLHYLDIGRLEGRETLSPMAGAEDAATEAPARPEPAANIDWSALRGRAAVADATLDVIVPVYKGRIETLLCLSSVLKAHCKTVYELVVVDDASPDSELAQDLQRLAAQGLFTLLRNGENRGFVHSVNRGMALHPQRDVLLLNSDTEVYNDWLDRLAASAHADPRAGAVSPLSNNATICSYPRFLHDNPYPLEIDYAELDALAARVNAGLRAIAPTAVGFCMFIRRDCLREAGAFDEEAFGKGYGEENDFCQRALRLGWHSVIAADVFVRHWGAGSFMGEKAQRVQGALRTLARRHPDYRRQVEEFIERDPLREARRRLDWARLEARKQARNLLFVCHARGGGAERRVQEDIARVTARGQGVFTLRPDKSAPGRVVLGQPQLKQLPNLPHFSLAQLEALGGALARLGIGEVHRHSVVDFVPDACERLVALARQRSLRLEINLHDYLTICPRINLADTRGRYCGEPDAAACNRCIAKNGSEFGQVEIGRWRAMHRRALAGAAVVRVPNEDAAERLQRHFPEISLEVSPHEDISAGALRLREPVLAAEERLRIAVIGAIGHIKGYEVLLACARDARRRRLALEFVLLGYSLNDRALEDAGVHISGRYLEAEAHERLLGLRPHAAWIPSTWPETYSYTLSIALKSGLPAFAFDLGAIARRLKRLDSGAGLMPIRWASEPATINGFFIDYRRARVSGGSEPAIRSSREIQLRKIS